MSVRIHTAIGYALTDVVNASVHAAGVDDPRINTARLRDVFDDPSLNAASYLAYVEKLGSRWARFEAQRLCTEKPLRQLGDCIIYDAEFLSPNVLLFIPPTMKGWKRVDDNIDYYEAVVGDQSATGLGSYLALQGLDPAQVAEAIRVAGLPSCMSTSVSPIPIGLYPFSRYSDRLSGRAYTENELELVNHLAGTRPEGADAVAVELGFSCSAEMLERVGPWPPEAVRVFCEFTGIFADPAAIWQLTPVRLRWWG